MALFAVMVLGAGACSLINTYDEVAPATATGGAGGTGGGGAGPTCGHDICVVGPPLLAADCIPCVGAVCLARPSCCQDVWDQLCVEQLVDTCTPLTCPISSCDPAYPSAPGGDPCPAECSSCSGSECTISCSSDSPCSSQALTCPAGYDCTVSCTGTEACLDTTVTCPPSGRCRVLCSGTSACAGAAIQCRFGPCELGCDYTGASQTCAQAELGCSVEHCTTSCSGTVDEPPAQSCGDACECDSTC